MRVIKANVSVTEATFAWTVIWANKLCQMSRFRSVTGHCGDIKRDSYRFMQLLELTIARIQFSINHVEYVYHTSSGVLRLCEDFCAGPIRIHQDFLIFVRLRSTSFPIVGTHHDHQDLSIITLG
ncbi:hypothetical protein DFH28DRAFT_1125659 [Melampsora americana]|nr:hypothetical protein DFH28DRAFT_1125659 [Melampsora americana]